VDKAYLRETLQTKPELFAGILRFNLPASSGFMPGHLTEQAAALLHSGLLGVLEGSAQGARLVRGYLFKHSRPVSGKGEKNTSGPPEFFTDFQEERRRLALLTPKQLQDLVLLFGAGIYALKIAKIVKRDEVLALRSFLGPYYTYSLLRGRFQMGQVRGLFQPRAGNLPLTGRIVAAGLEALQICMADWPQALRERAGLLLDATLFAESPLAGWPAHIEKKPETLKTVWVNLKKILLQELAPECQPFFA
jgi:hypothetical protein